MVVLILIALLIEVVLIIAVAMLSKAGYVEVPSEPRNKVLKPIQLAHGYKTFPEDRVRGSPMR